jgi:hypothetical protein
MFFVVSGILGIILVSTQHERSLILLSSWGGATLVSKHINPQNRSTMVMIFLVLILVGVFVQAVILGS